MKLIGAGLPRTATTTQKVALEMLGLSTYHMVDLMSDFADLGLWERAEQGEDVWDELLAGKDATVDWPGARFYAPLMERYPDAKVLLSVRDHESWEQSMRDTICQIYFGDVVMRHLSDARILIDRNWHDWIMLMRQLTWEGRGPMTDAPETTEGLIRSARRWDEEVKATVPADRLLVWEAAEGWEPLCEFLELPVPDEEFPHVNDTDAFRQGIVGGAVAAISAWWEENQPGVEPGTRG
jgi:sulfotransferase family protein